MKSFMRSRTRSVSSRQVGGGSVSGGAGSRLLGRLLTGASSRSKGGRITVMIRSGARSGFIGGGARGGNREPPGFFSRLFVCWAVGLVGCWACCLGWGAGGVRGPPRGGGKGGPVRWV